MTVEPTASASDAWTIGRLLSWTRDYFQAKGLDEPRLAAELLLARALDCSKIELYTRIEHAPTDDQRTAFREKVKEAADGVPIAYLIGRKEFYSLDFEVVPGVLIPRPETEVLVEHALAWCAEHSAERIEILDIGTGSGCIAVTMVVREPRARVLATDCSAEALTVGRANVNRHGATDRVRLIEADMLDLPADAVPEQGFDLVLSNPPYVAENAPESLADNVRRHEPAVALYGGPDGFDAYRRIAAGVGDALNGSGALFLEIGMGQEDRVASIIEEESGLRCVGRFRDPAGILRTLQFERP